MELYIVGPVSGRENRNIGAFKDARKRLIEAGAWRTSAIPHDFIPPESSHEHAMLMSLEYMLERAKLLSELGGGFGIALLKDWCISEGAKFERQVAEACGAQVKTVDDWVRELGK